MATGQSTAEMLQTEALRLYARYASEVVEAFGFCPWASEARRKGEVQVEVMTGPACIDATLASMAALATREDLAIGLLVFPRVQLGRVEWQRFAGQVRETDRHRCHPAPTCWAVADFHPAAAPDTSSAQTLVPFIRSSPDPTLQLVRHSVLDHIRRGETSGTQFVDVTRLDFSRPLELADASEPVHARVASRNLETVTRQGAEAVRAVMRDIQRDRFESYQRLGLPPAPWESFSCVIGDRADKPR